MALRADIEAGLQRGLESKLSDSRFDSVDDLVDALQRHRGAICRVVGGANLGTGFLLSRNLICTSFHVVKSEIDRGKLAGDVRFQFDYSSADCLEVRAGTLVAHSPTDSLDFAFFRVSDEDAPHIAGRTVIRSRASAAAQHEILVVLQHPAGDELKCTFGAVKAVFSDRITHGANTIAGSSGAPCLRLGPFEVVGIHRQGGEGANAAIPFTAVFEQLKHNGHAELARELQTDSDVVDPGLLEPKPVELNVTEVIVDASRRRRPVLPPPRRRRSAAHTDITVRWPSGRITRYDAGRFATVGDLLEAVHAERDVELPFASYGRVWRLVHEATRTPLVGMRERMGTPTGEPCVDARQLQDVGLVAGTSWYILVKL